MVFELNQAGRGINRKRVQRLMRVMGIEALVPRPGTSKAAPGHKIYPYLLRGVAITEPNHVWACDITYIPMASGFLYLVAIIDWASRAVLAWRLSNTMDTRFCIAALDEALARHGTPEIFNTDQGAQFTSAAFTGRLEAAGIAISMDGRGRFMDNIFIERLWRSIKYEEVHLKAYADGREARAGIGSWMNFYNSRRPHQAMNNQMPMAVWRAGMDRIEAAARPVDMPLRLDNANALPTYPQQSRNNRRKRLKGFSKRKKKERAGALHLNSNGPWSHEWGPLQSDVCRIICCGAARLAIRAIFLLYSSRKRDVPGRAKCWTFTTASIVYFPLPPRAQRQLPQIEPRVRRLLRRKRRSRADDAPRGHVVGAAVDGLDHRELAVAETEGRESARRGIAAHHPAVDAVREAGDLQFEIALIAPEPRQRVCRPPVCRRGGARRARA